MREGEGLDQHTCIAHILMMKTCKYLDFPESALTVGLMLKRTDLLYCNLRHTLVVESRAAEIDHQFDHSNALQSTFGPISTAINSKEVLLR